MAGQLFHANIYDISQIKRDSVKPARKFASRWQQMHETRLINVL